MLSLQGWALYDVAPWPARNGPGGGESRQDIRLSRVDALPLAGGRRSLAL